MRADMRMNRPVRSRTVRHAGTLAVFVTAFALVALSSACGDVNAALATLSDARQLSADLLVEFTKASDASDRAVMADTDEASVTFAHEAEQATQAAQDEAGRLGTILQEQHYTDEARLLQEFVQRFAQYRMLDRRILDLAVENTNLKAQRLSYGAGQKEADTFRDSLDAIAAAAPATENWHTKALVATAVAAVREIEVLQAPHIAEPDDAAMSGLEKRMATSESEARSALRALATLLPASARTRLGTSTASLDRFMELNAQILVLSRRNTNVRSLALSLDQKRALVAPCENTLRALRDALAKRGYPSGR